MVTNPDHRPNRTHLRDWTHCFPVAKIPSVWLIILCNNSDCTIKMPFCFWKFGFDFKLGESIAGPSRQQRKKRRWKQSIWISEKMLYYQRPEGGSMDSWSLFCHHPFSSKPSWSHINQTSNSMIRLEILTGYSQSATVFFPTKCGMIFQPGPKSNVSRFYFCVVCSHL